ncbi:MAG: hypothetical protein M3292_05130, partial [Actinomycetota bacterium]|nr:hypothetical protein [Actinomycetota bacterium]
MINQGDQSSFDEAAAPPHDDMLSRSGRWPLRPCCRRRLIGLRSTSSLRPMVTVEHEVMVSRPRSEVFA